MSAEYTEHVYQEYYCKSYEPIHQREEIVRCRDCVWFDGRPNYQLCRRDMSCDEIALYAEPDGFCAWGERKVER